MKFSVKIKVKEIESITYKVLFSYKILTQKVNELKNSISFNIIIK